jgi:hypothetical protein
MWQDASIELFSSRDHHGNRARFHKPNAAWESFGNHTDGGKQGASEWIGSFRSVAKYRKTCGADAINRRQMQTKSILIFQEAQST